MVFLVASVQGAEWMTSGGHHCIERCHTGTRKGLDAVQWCRVVDGVSKEHRPVGAESGRPSVHEEEDLTEEDKYAWDYCTPATVDALEGGEVFEEGVEAVVLPERVDRSKRQTGKSVIEMIEPKMIYLKEGQVASTLGQQSVRLHPHWRVSTVWVNAQKTLVVHTTVMFPGTTLTTSSAALMFL